MTTPRLAYALFMLLALATFVLARRLQPRPPGFPRLRARESWFLALAALVGGVLGAKLPFALAGEHGWLSQQSWLADGKTLVTGLAGAYLGVEAAKWFMGIKLKTGDAFALPLAFALAIGRWGCFCNGCCHGTPTDLPWGVDFGDGIRRHPTQIYESLFHLVMAFVLLWIIAHGWLRSQRLKFYLLAYCGYRFLTEFIRPEPEWFLGLTFYQWAALALAAGLLGQWRRDRRSQLAPEDLERA